MRYDNTTSVTKNALVITIEFFIGMFKAPSYCQCVTYPWLITAYVSRKRFHINIKRNDDKCMCDACASDDKF